MELKDLAILIPVSLTGIGVIAAGIGYFMQSYKKSSRTERSEVITSSETIAEFWKGQAEDLKAVIAEKDKMYDEKIQVLTREVGELRGQLNAETAAKKEYLEILQNRDPQTQKFMEFVIKAIENQSLVNKEILDKICEIHAMTKAEHDRDFQINATITKQ